MKARVNRLLPLIIFFVVAIGGGTLVKRLIDASQTPLLDPSHPKVIAGELPKVTLYSASWCSYCRAARSYFDIKKVPFVELDIEKNQLANQQFKQLRGSGVPLITINQRTIHGFDKKRFDAYYIEEFNAQ